MKLLLSALTAVVLTVACTTGIDSTGGQGGGATPAPTATETSSGALANKRCPFPSLRPTYLPWLARGEAIPRPVRSYDEEIERAQLSWSNPEDAKDGVGLTVYPRPSGTPEKKLGVKIQGATGYLHHGPGETSAWWDLDARCNFLELSIVLAPADQGRLDRELVRIARSLVRSP